MNKNLYKYAAMGVIVETLNAKAVQLRANAGYTKEIYEPTEDGVPNWVQDSIDKDSAIADFIDDFISKL